MEPLEPKCKTCGSQVDKIGRGIAPKMHEKFSSPSLTADALVFRKHKDDNFHDILLVIRKYDPFKDHYAFPGGFVDYNEDPLHGCLRELKEETNLDGQKAELVAVAGDPQRDPRKHIVTIAYKIEVDENAVPKAGDDAKKAKFYPLKSILESKDKLAFDHYDILVECIKKYFASVYPEIK